MTRRTVSGLVFALLAATMACESISGLEDKRTKVVIRQLDSSSASSALIADVRSLDLTIGGVRMIQTQTPVRLDYVGPGVVNVVALPTDRGIELAKGILPAAGYTSVELEIPNATITFSREVTIGTGASAQTFAANQAHPLKIVRDGSEGIVRVRLPSLKTYPGYAPTVTVQFDGVASGKRLKVVNGGLVLDPIFTAGGL